MKTKKTSTLDQVYAILDHPRATQEWVVRPIMVNGKPAIERLARIATVYPRDGAGRLRVVVTDWTNLTPEGDPMHHIGTATGYGYDKRTAALAGATVGGVELGDHSDHHGRPTLGELCLRNGWELFGG